MKHKNISRLMEDVFLQHGPAERSWETRWGTILSHAHAVVCGFRLRGRWRGLFSAYLIHISESHTEESASELHPSYCLNLWLWEERRLTPISSAALMTSSPANHLVPSLSVEPRGRYSMTVGFRMLPSLLVAINSHPVSTSAEKSPDIDTQSDRVHLIAFF